MNPFGTEGMAEGYATFRPPVHQRILERARPAVPPAKIGRALDLGCGAGLSTRALTSWASHCIGMDPAEAMLGRTSTVAPEADFLVGTAEAIPLANTAVDLIAAAGSLNYVRFDPFFGEAHRVLARDGVLLVYDFSPGRRFVDSPALAAWFDEFQRRYPPPPREAVTLDPAILATIDARFQLIAHETIETSLTLSRQFYLEYMLTETNVAFAVRRGVELAEIRGWCGESLNRFWDSADRAVTFEGYFAVLQPVR
jgi:ubiquinone/menaquinone biosynthesis C-methylase UbiE